MNKGNLDDAKRRNQQSAQNVSGQGGMQTLNSTGFNASSSMSNLNAVKKANDDSKNKKR